MRHDRKVGFTMTDLIVIIAVAALSAAALRPMFSHASTAVYNSNRTAQHADRGTPTEGSSMALMLGGLAPAVAVLALRRSPSRK